ncbi:hypothetical protein RN001_012154 [Aquatica leii]|uniref:Medium-chain acyl-CoA ligase ACSF2, mitochondrial n=1 Tax=Aquatica leii TaxID=1421715 RepID=A0AAN7SD61_9COLE|nr:hypothetical protein RN001_012154 [Aquatica leii]
MNCILKNLLPCIKFKIYISRSLTRLSYIHNVGKTPLQYITIGNLVQKCALKYEEKTAIISMEENREMTFSQILIESDKLAAGFHKIGLKIGDKIGLWAPNIIEWFLVFYASARAGLVTVALNPAYTEHEMEYSINKVGIKTIICPESYKKLKFYNIMCRLVTDLQDCDRNKIHSTRMPSLQSIITISNNTLKGTYSYQDVINCADHTSIKTVTTIQNCIQPDDLLCIQYTSGTTGKPKATCLGHFQLVNNALELGNRLELEKYNNNMCVQVPLFHAFGILGAVMPLLLFGVTTTLPSGLYNSRANLRAVEKKKCTIINGTPTMFLDLICLQKKENKKLHLNTAYCGGAPCAPRLFKDMHEILKIKNVKSVYGLTEATGIIFQSLPNLEDDQKAYYTVGKVLDHLEVKVVDKNDNIVPMGTPGELCVRGYSVMLGYYDDKEKTEEVMKYKWLKTGDQVVLQEDGYGRVVGRLKDIIIRGGENIFPREIEDILNEHPDIVENYVIGLPHDRLGEEVCACVSVNPGANLDIDSIVKHCQGKLAKFKIPKDNRKVLFNDLFEESRKLAAGFYTLGLRKGDRIGLWAPNIVEFITTWFAAAQAGLIVVLLNPSYVNQELEYCLNKVGTKALVCPDVYRDLRFYDTLTNLLPELETNDRAKLRFKKVPLLKFVITISNNKNIRGTYNFTEVVNISKSDSLTEFKKMQEYIQPDDIANIHYTSGTTGKPKATCLSHFQIVNNGYLVAKRLGLDKNHCNICIPVPFFHVFGTTVGIIAAQHFGSTLILPSPMYSPVATLKAIEQETCTVIYGTPTMYIDFINLQINKKMNINVTDAFCGASPTSLQLCKNIRRILNVKKVHCAYGMTEATAIAFHSLLNEESLDHMNTVGYIGEHLEAKVVDANNNVVPIGTPGELCLRGYSVMKGYWDDETETRKILGDDNWLKTGDRFILQGNGYGKIVGRIKDVIIRGGEKIYPKEIEDFLCTHPDILENYVIGLTHNRLGEEVCACIMLKIGSNFNFQTMVEFCKNKLTKSKIPSQMKIMKSFPKTGSGKIQKYVLKQQIEAEFF